MDVRCEQALERLWPLTDPGELNSPDLVAAREHLQQCGACRAFFRRDANLGRRIHDLRTTRVSGLSEARHAAVRLQLAGDAAASDPDIRPIRSGRRRRLPAWTESAVAAAAAIVLLGGGLTLSRNIETPLSNGAFAKDFMHAELPELESANLSPTQVAAFYEKQFGDQMAPARLLDAPVKRVAVCEVDGRRGAMVEYEFAGERLVYYQIPLDGRLPGNDLRTGREGSLNVARWGDDRSEHVLVSALPVQNLKAMAMRPVD